MSIRQVWSKHRRATDNHHRAASVHQKTVLQDVLSRRWSNSGALILAFVGALIAIVLGYCFDDLRSGEATKLRQLAAVAGIGVCLLWTYRLARVHAILSRAAGVVADDHILEASRRPFALHRVDIDQHLYHVQRVQRKVEWTLAIVSVGLVAFIVISWQLDSILSTSVGILLSVLIVVSVVIYRYIRGDCEEAREALRQMALRAPAARVAWGA